MCIIGTIYVCPTCGPRIEITYVRSCIAGPKNAHCSEVVHIEDHELVDVAEEDAEKAKAQVQYQKYVEIAEELCPNCSDNENLELLELSEERRIAFAYVGKPLKGFKPRRRK